MLDLDPFDYVFPIAGGVEKSNKEYILTNIFGTGFSVAENIFFTAGHVVQEIQAQELTVSIGINVENTIRHFPVTDVEVLPEIDLAILKTETSLKAAKQFRWNLKKLGMLQEVSAVGFPFAVDFSESKAYVRSFRGYIVSEHDWERLLTKPRVYEISFLAPAGLSGSPLLLMDIPPSVCGYIIGNSKIEIPVLRDIERISEDKSKIIVERYEMSTFGISITIESIMDIKSQILGGSIKKFLVENELILKI